MAALPQLIVPPPRLPEGVTGLVCATASFSQGRREILDEAMVALASLERETKELEQFVAGLAQLELAPDRGPQPDEEVIANVIKVTEEIVAWATNVTDAREDNLTRLQDQLEDLCAADKLLTPLARQVYQRQEELSGRIQALAGLDLESLVGNLLVQVAKQRELSSDEKWRLLQTIPDDRPIDNPVSTRRADWYSDSPSTHRSDWYT
ncbi:MAG: hypothetical protein OXF44_03345 [Anaerolineaceae bacterium]|nr:hypothetical protein [Anaerolineaceae bacterium]